MKVVNCSAMTLWRDSRPPRSAAAGAQSHARAGEMWAVCLVLGLWVWACGGDLLMQKCCPEQEQLDAKMRSCVPYAGPETPRFPWWMDGDRPPLSSSTLRPVEAFLPLGDVRSGARQPCGRDATREIRSSSNEYQLLDNGTLLFWNTSFGPAAYCLDRVDVGAFVMLLCPCEQVPCVRKCCPPSRLLRMRHERRTVALTCVRLNETQAEAPWRHNGSAATLYRFPRCEAGRRPAVLDSRFWLLANGSALVEFFGARVLFPSDQYCADLALLEDGVLVNHVVTCAPLGKEKRPDEDAMFYGSLFVIGSVFLAATLLVFAVLPEMRTLHCKTLMGHTASLLLAYVVLATGKLQSNMADAACIALAFVIQFSFLAAFFWLNVMCIDISWAFSGFRPPQGSATERDRKKFLYYSLYAWGSPTVITIVTAVMEYVASIPDTYIKPDFGVKACWFKEKRATLAYFYGPMAALLLANFALFVYTSVKIILVQRATRILHSDESGRHDGGSFNKDKKRLMLYGKLFCLMGLTWITEIISWAEGNMKYFWYVTDGINLLRAVFIFIIFCCKPKVFRLLKQRLHSWGLFPSYNPSLENGRSTGTRKSSSSTQQSSLHSLQMTQLGNGGSSRP